MLSGPGSAAITVSPQSAKHIDEKSVKRKREDVECEVPPKDEEEDIKKVCREGFHFCHHVWQCTASMMQLGLLCVRMFRPPHAARLRGCEVRRAWGNAGRSRSTSRHERLSINAARSNVTHTSIYTYTYSHMGVVFYFFPSLPLFANIDWCFRRSRASYFAVFDGHGGTRASRFAAEHLHHILATKFPRGEQ